MTLKRENTFLLISIVLALVKLWLVSGQTLFAAAYAVHDDRLFLILADSLLKGNWLGPYNNLTLIKGPFYPIWIAAAFLSDIPLLIAQHLLYISACYLFILSVKPVTQKQTMLSILFVLLLFNPITYTDRVGTAVLREGIYPALTLLVLSGSIGILIRYNHPVRNLARWTILLGTAFAAFWLTREEGIWMVPTVLLILGVAIFKIYSEKTADRTRRLLCVSLSFVIVLISVFAVAAINKSYYGVLSTVEFRSTHFPDAYGALARVRHSNWHPMVPVPGDVRERVYAVSPSFRELRPYLEGELGSRWTQISCQESSVCDAMAGGWFVWAFRDAAAMAGYHASAGIADAFYARVASEINAACAEGNLDCGPGRSGFSPPWHAEYARPLFNTFADAAVYVATFKDIDASPDASVGDRHSLLLFADITNQMFFLHKPSLPHQLRIADLKIDLLNNIGSIYRYVVPWLAILSLIVYAVNTLHVFRKRFISDLYIVASAAGIAIVIRLFILSLLDIASFPAVDTQYLSPAYPLLLAAIVLSFLDLKGAAILPPKK